MARATFPPWGDSVGLAPFMRLRVLQLMRLTRWRRALCRQDDFGFSKQEILAYYASFMEVLHLERRCVCVTQRAW